MRRMDLYFSRMSGNSARAVFGLLEAGVAWNRRPVEMPARENRTDQYLALNPMGKVPALEDGAFRLWESNAINWYVAETTPACGLLPSTAAGRASVQRWLMFQNGHVTPRCVPIFMATHAGMQAYWNTTGDPQAAAASTPELHRFLRVLDDALAERDYLENEFSLADIAFVPHLVLIAEGGFDLTAYARLSAWLNRLIARPAWKETARIVFGGR